MATKPVTSAPFVALLNTLAALAIGSLPVLALVVLNAGGGR